MTNKLSNETPCLAVYIANLEEYNNGNRVGGWISLPIEKSVFKDFLETIGNPEEYAIHDFNDSLGLGDLEIGGYDSIDKLNNLTRRLSNIAPNEIHIINALYEALEDIEKALDFYESDKYVYYGCITMKEVAQEFLNGAHTIPSYFNKHIDYKSIAMDMLNNGYYITAYGVIEIL